MAKHRPSHETPSLEKGVENCSVVAILQKIISKRNKSVKPVNNHAGSDRMCM